MPPRVLLVDNVDSFTYNVADLLHRVLGAAPVVWRHDHPATAADLAAFDAVVVGPGPGRPQVVGDMGLSDLALRQTAVPVLGVCLGHQGLAHLHGGTVAQMAVPRHGIVSEVEHDGTGLFEGVPQRFRVVRYHSLEVLAPLPEALAATARATDDGSLMALEDRTARRWGVQFHPESVLSEHGERIVANFLRLAGVAVARGPSAGPDVVGVGDALAPHPPRRGGRPVRVEVCRAPRPGGAAVDPWALRERLVGGSPTSVWLDASDGTGWSLLVDSTGPLASELTHRVGEDAPLLDRLDTALAGWDLVGPAPEVPFTWRPGYVGYWGYELRAETGATPGGTSRSPWPDAWLTFADRGVVLDHATGDVWVVWLEDVTDPSVGRVQRAWADRVADAVAAPARPVAAAADGVTDPRAVLSSHGGRPDDHRDTTAAHERLPDGAGVEARGDSGSPTAPRPRDDGTAYLQKVRACQEEIARGESYEICLTTTWSAEVAVDEAELYRAMRQVSPVPHGAWLRTPSLSVLGCSPERFVSVDGEGRVETRPIKGTRPRGATPQDDAALAGDLATAEKDRAENLMIVDLLRNDLHRVCRTGSVHVPELFAVETYATVHQLVSTVRGRLVDGMGPTDVLRACFPGGSMTGAPKVRTMQILDRLEGAPRGVYSGAVGWIGLDGSMDTSIVIRTATWEPGRVTFGVGGAVTALSDPAEEHAETLAKAAALRAALARASGRAAGQSG
ncbi:aminodeoxychorismate synthase component I [Ornithinimicrobium pekingense]|uniref:aminodeoxychorismate synthase n=1 Tax=Ornithinimicrobium pekingense TaxID=384677 RepID=A0ABQ2FDR3_9MICO|nr:aminodeoxychorismate synthase component I [Ornithinimicrobium pekingense]GGK77564.1 aminodeoxychorismate synthase, component I [Ornithinimicrobium pekingense]